MDVALAGTLPFGFFPLTIRIFNAVKLLIYIRHHLLWVVLMLTAFFSSTFDNVPREEYQITPN